MSSLVARKWSLTPSTVDANTSEQAVPLTSREGSANEHVSAITRPSNVMNALLRQALRRLLWLILSIPALIIIGIIFAYGIAPAMFNTADYNFDSWPQFNLTDHAQTLKPMDPAFSSFNIAMQAHVHTTISDGILRPKQVLEWTVKMGYNAVVLTDHNTQDGVKEAILEVANHPGLYNDLIVIPGVELSDCRVHLNIIGVMLSDSINKTASDLIQGMLAGTPWPTDTQLQDLIVAVHSLGGVISVNHLPWSIKIPDALPGTNYPDPWHTLTNSPTLEQWIAWGIDFVEIVNGDTFDFVSWQYIESLPKPRTVGILTGSDMHQPLISGVYSWSVLNAPNKTVAGVISALRQHSTSFIFDASGSMSYFTKDEISRIQPFPRTSGYDYSSLWLGFGEIPSYFYDRTHGMTSFQGPLCRSNYVGVNRRAIFYALVNIILLWLVLEILWFGMKLGLQRIRSIRNDRLSAIVNG